MSIYMIGNTWCSLCQRDEESLKRELIATVRAFYYRGLVSNNGGNHSARLPGSDRIWITPSGYPRMSITPKDLVLVDINGNILEGDLKPSIELRFHLEIYRNRPDVNAVVHTHSPYTLGMAISGAMDITHGEAAAILMPGVKIVPFALPGTVELAKYVGEAVKGHGMVVTRVVILMNHGIIAVGSCIHEARAFAEMMEEWARFNMAARAFGGIKYRITLEDLKKPGARYVRGIKFGGRSLVRQQ